MHLGHEVKFFKYIILIPYIIFMFYTIFVILTEGTYSGSSTKATRIDPIFVEQQKALKQGHHSSGVSKTNQAEPAQNQEQH